MKDVNLKNTKNEIYEAYEVALKKIKELEDSKVDTAKLVVEKTNKEIIKSAENVIGLGVLNAEIVEQYNNLLKAIELKKQELNDLYGIEVEANTLASLVNANVDKQIEYSKKDKETEEAFKKRCSDRELEYRDLEKKLEEGFRVKSKELTRKYEEEEMLLRQKRARDEENYKYDITRNRKLENDKWEDEKAVREKCLSDREFEISKREAQMDEMDVIIEELRAKVDEIPTLIEVAKKEAEENKAKDLARHHAIEKNSILKDAQWEKKILDQQVENLTKELDKAHDKATELEGKLNEAYKEIKEIATKTVQSSGVRIIETNSKNEK